MELFCQTCFTSFNDRLKLSDLFEENLHKLLEECVSVKIEPAQKETFICQECKRILLEFKQFKTRCIETQRLLEEKRLEHSKYWDSGFPESVKLENSTSFVKIEDDLFDEPIDNLSNELTSNRKLPINCYRCLYCSEMFENKNCLKDHIPSHTEKHTYGCIYCDVKINGLGKLSRHFNIIHTDLTPEVDCNECSETFHTDDQLLCHICLKHSQAECPLCQQPFSSKMLIEKHLKEHGEEASRFQFSKARVRSLKSNRKRKDDKNKQVQRCPVCAGTFSKEEFEIHLSVHNRLPWCKCPKCQKLFYGINKFNSHMKARHRDLKADIQCDQCELRFHINEQLNHHKEHSHLSAASKRTCKYCGLRTVTVRNLNRHIATIHLTDLVKCTVCGKTLKNQLQLRAHMYGHKYEHAEKSVCNVCGLTFHNLASHMRNIHLKTDEEKRMPCRYKCGLFCDDRVALFNHYRNAHKNEMEDLNYECKICHKRFLGRYYLHNHYRYTHDDSRPHKCTLCDKSFKRPYLLNVHMRSHTDERPFYCEICGKHFRRGRTLSLHKLTHTGEKNHICNDCGKKFAQRTTLKTHMKIHQKNQHV